MLAKLLELTGPQLDRAKLELLLRDLVLCVKNEKLSALRLAQLQVGAMRYYVLMRHAIFLVVGV